MKKMLGIAVLLLTVVLVWATPAAGSPPDIQAVKTRGYLIVGMTRFDNAPFYSGSGSDLRGIDVDIARRVGDYLGVPVQFRRDAASFQEVVDQVTRGEIDIALSKLSITGPRMQTVRFTRPYVKLRQAMVVNRLWLSQKGAGKDPLEIVRGFDGKLAFIRNSSYDTFARINFPNAQYEPLDNWNDVVSGVMSGRFAAGFRDEFEIKRIAFERPEASISTKTVTITDLVDSIAGAVDYRRTTLLSIADHVIDTEFSKIDIRRLLTLYRQSLPPGAPR